MTAQNMGKKILTDAGYDVIAVSNRAAAVKKIAEHKPHIIILDDHMPESTVLEVCEKVRARAEAPVPAERAGAHVPDPQENKVQGTVDVPDHMAMAAVFSDLLGTEPVHNMEPFQAANSNHAEFHVAAGPQHVETPSASPIEPQVEEVPSGFSVEPNVEKAPAALAVEPQVEHAPIPFPVQPHAASAPPAIAFPSSAHSELTISLMHSSDPVQVEPAEETMIMPSDKELEHDQD